MNQECWTEMDLNWFQGGLVDEKVEELFNRLSSLWHRQPEARKGLTLCVG